MRNQFFYTRITESGKELRDSFNVNKIIRFASDEDGSAIVLLDDIHERADEVPDIDPRTQRLKGMKRQKNAVQTQIVLSPEDAARFFNLLNIEG